MNEKYFKQVELLLSILPTVMKEGCFALKGGTAINFFWRNLPRLSVDIDLVYLPLQDRKNSLSEIDRALMRIKERVCKLHNSCRFIEKRIKGGSCITLSAIYNDTLVKIEPNMVLRGSIFPTCERDITPEVEKRLNIPSFVTVKSLAKAELYGGKIVAALDRQHPRDLFDVKILLDNEGISKDVITAFVVYIAGHNRPMHEVLKPKPKDIQPAFDSEFTGMTLITTSIDELVKTRTALFDLIPGVLNENERDFLISTKRGEPKWDLLPLQGLEKLPAIQWKLHNIVKIEKKKHHEQLERLEHVLER